jgi:hypothetical protein
MTLSSPHLGYMYNSNDLIGAGINTFYEIKRSLVFETI